MSLGSLRNPPEINQLIWRTASLRFPAGFLWGVSTAAHQVEGGNENNQWSAWEAAGRIKSGESSGRACDWWRNAEQDLDLAAEMGLNALRLSVEWSRLEPREGHWSRQAFTRYREILKGLHQRRIQPMVCLHHFTHPQWFEEKGAFLCPGSAVLFECFARRVLEELGDLCQMWVTFNEPNVYAALGFVLGEFPPGRTGEIATALRVIHSMGQAHAHAYRVIHQLQPEAHVGWAHNYAVFEPNRRSCAADRWLASLLSELFNESFLRLMERGRLHFPLNLFNGQEQQMVGTYDFVGLNVYSRFHVAFSPTNCSQLFADVFVPPHVPQGDTGADKPYGEVYPPAIRYAVERTARLGKPIYILENGVPDSEDRIRPWLIAHALEQVHGLLQKGHNIRGYYHWTLTDNFEWSEGWRLRFGLVALDCQTQRRTMRRSAHLYSAIARANALLPEMMSEF